MPLRKEKKEQIVKELKEVVAKAPSLVFVNFHGLTVLDVNTMRSQLRNQNVNYRVAKKTLIKKALENIKIEGELPNLEGEIAITWGNDSLAPAREVYNFQKKYKNILKIVGGVFENKYLDQESMTEIASIPPIEVLYGQFVNIINSPIQGLVIALSQIGDKRVEKLKV